ncbi:protein argonaute-2-like isoform X5 [Rhynchophorus ferrugineus]|uniref:protein argonaute-2-like isoform X3 n=1 Tax=Rhynchophorus ferrugineus TaxID=354439 RepID=UPI003FCC4566
MGKKKGKKSDKQPASQGTQPGQPSGSQDDGQRGDTPKPQSRPPQHGKAQHKGQQGPAQQQRGPQQQGGPSQQQRGPQQQGGPLQQQFGPPVQQQRGSQQQGGPLQQQFGPPVQQQRGPQQQGGPSQQQRGPQQQGGPLQQQFGPPVQQQRGPQQQGGPSQQQRSPQQQGGPLQQQFGPPVQQQRGSQQQGGPLQQQFGPPVQQQRGPQQQGGPSQQQRGPQQQGGPLQQQFGPPVQQQRGPQQQGGPSQQQRGPQQQGGPLQQQFGPPVQQQRGPQQQGGPSQQQRGPQQQGGPLQQQFGPPVQQQRGPQQQGGPLQQQFGPPVQQQRGPQQQGGPLQQQTGSHQQGGPPQQWGPPQQVPQSFQKIEQRTAPQQKGPPQKQEPVHQRQGPKSQQPGRPEDRGDENLVSKYRSTPGKNGRKIRVESNHFELNLSKLNDVAYHYDVEIEPVESKAKIVPKKLMRPIINEFTKKLFPQRNPAFDGQKNIYTSTPLHPNLDMLFEEQVAINDEGKTRTFKVTVKSAKTNPIDMTVIKNCLSIASTPREALQVIDIVLRMASLRNCLPVGRSFYRRPERPIDLSGGMEAYTGFYQSAIRGWKPLLNVDVAFKAFYKSIPVIDALLELFVTRNSQPRVSDLAQLQEYQVANANKYLRMLRIQYELPNFPGSRKFYRVNRLFSSASSHRFDCQGQTITIQQYFSQHKNYPIRYPDIPLLHVGDPNRADKILIPMELCTIVPGQPLRGKSNEEQTRQMIRYAATSTDVRKKKISDGLRMADYNSSPAVREFNITVGSEFQQLEARVLEPPPLKYANRTEKVARGVWKSSIFLKPATISLWTIAIAVQRYPPRPDDLKNMQRLLVSEASRAGMSFSSPAAEPFPTIGGRQTYADVLKFFQQQESKKYDIIFVVVPDSGPQYSYVKRAAETQTGCLTQCVKQTTVCRKMNQMTALNILLKVNSKMNGTNHALGDRPPILGRPVMIMGADVTHPSPDSQNIPSVAAVTASHDSNAFKYNICWRLQDPKLEIIGDLKNIVVEQLHFFKQETNRMPEAIVFFRDGVSEGQFEEVVTKEVAAIRGACKQMQKEGFEPRVTFLVVQKRHHTRLFPKDSRDSQDKNNNVPAGTCVDTDITHPFMTDFYLVSHASIQGVAKPTKYCVLHDDNNMDHDQIQQLTYYLCHMFTRCNRSVSYPAPTYYAHLAAARGKTYIENVDIDLQNLEQEFRRYQIKDSIQKAKPMFFV